jgi:hypothetical protein
MRTIALMVILVATLSGFSDDVRAREELLTFGREYHPGPGSWWDTQFTCGMFCVADVQVWARSRYGLKSVTFSAPLPACLDVSVYQFQTPHTVMTGDIETGITVAFDSCLVSEQNANGYLVQDIFVGRIVVAVNATPTCCTWFPLPAAGSHRIEGIDCDNKPIILSHQGVIFNPVWDGVCGAPSVPWGEYPASGSEVSPGTVTLDWDCGMPAGSELGEFRQDVWFGSDPAQLQRIGYHEVPPYQVVDLEPGRTYYWRVNAVVDYGGTTGPIWSFTTKPTTPVKPVTWGTVKSLFRQQ